MVSPHLTDSYLIVARIFQNLTVRWHSVAVRLLDVFEPGCVGRGFEFGSESSSGNGAEKNVRFRNDPAPYGFVLS